MIRSEGVGVGSPDAHSFIHSFIQPVPRVPSVRLEDPQYAVEVDGLCAGLGPSTGEN